MTSSETPPGNTQYTRPDSHFSWIRTRLAADRTLMAYVRTSAALIGFEFTIFEFFAYMQGTLPPSEALRRPEGPRAIGLALIGVGTLGILFGLLQYLALIRYLWSDQF